MIGIVFSLVFLSASNVKAGGSFFLGANHALTETHLVHNFSDHKVDDLGVSFGLILPIMERRFFLSYKGSFAFHGLTDVIYGSNPSPDDGEFYRNLDQYIGALNGLVVGTRIDVSESMYLEPMLGVGVLVHVIYGNRGEGIAYGSYQADLSVLAMHEFETIDLGAWLSFGYVPYFGYLDQANFKYFSFGMALSI